MSRKDKRRHLRAPVELPLGWQKLDDPEMQFATSIDLSASGVSFPAPVRLGRGTRLRIAVTGEGLTFSAEARVARARADGDGFVLHVAFDSLPRETAVDISRLVVRTLASRPQDGER